MPALPAWLLPWALHSTALAVVGLAALALAGAMPPRARVRWLQGVLVAALAGPWLIGAMAPVWSAAPGGVRVVSGVFVLAAPPRAGTGASSESLAIVWLAWLTGVLLRAGWLTAGAARVRAWARDAATLVDPVFAEAQRLVGTGAQAAVSAAVGQPLTWGLRIPQVLVPSDLVCRPVAQRHAVYVHELLHVVRGDTRWLWLEEAVRTVLWPLPAVWLLMPRLRLAREQEVDADVVSLTGAPQAYVAALVWSADRGARSTALASPFFLKRHQLLTRVASLTREVPMSRTHLFVSTGVLAGVLVTAAVGLSALAPFPAISQPVADPDAAGPAERRAVLPTLDQPLPRRVVAVEPLPPAGMRPDDAGARFRVHAVVDASGAVTEVRIVAPRKAAAPPHGDPAMRQAVLAAVRQWQFEAPAVAPMLVVTDVAVGAPEMRSADADTPVRVGGGVPAPRKIYDEAPVYPPVALEARVQGVVVIETIIERTGDVGEVRLLRSVPLLDQAALEAVRQWKYEPRPHRLQLTTTVNFTLAADDQPR